MASSVPAAEVCCPAEIVHVPNHLWKTAEVPIGETPHAGRHPAAVTAAVLAATSVPGTHLVAPRLMLSTTSSFVEAVIEAEEAKVAMEEGALAKAKEDRRKEAAPTKAAENQRAGEELNVSGCVRTCYSSRCSPADHRLCTPSTHQLCINVHGVALTLWCAQPRPNVNWLTQRTNSYDTGVKTVSKKIYHALGITEAETAHAAKLLAAARCEGGRCSSTNMLALWTHLV